MIYDETVRDAAENRLEMTLALLREAGIEADGEVMDPDPYAAVMDALGEQDYDEIVISTHPETRSGWLRQGLVDRVAARHAPSRRARGRGPRHRARRRQAHARGRQPDGRRARRCSTRSSARPREEPRRFIVICPQAGERRRRRSDAAERLAHTLKALEDAGLEAIGQVVHPDPYTAIQNALQFYAPDDIVISTFPETRSGWLRARPDRAGPGLDRQAGRARRRARRSA